MRKIFTPLLIFLFCEVCHGNPSATAVANFNKAKLRADKMEELFNKNKNPPTRLLKKVTDLHRKAAKAANEAGKVEEMRDYNEKFERYNSLYSKKLIKRADNYNRKIFPIIPKPTMSDLDPKIPISPEITDTGKHGKIFQKAAVLNGKAGRTSTAEDRERQGSGNIYKGMVNEYSEAAEIAKQPNYNEQNLEEVREANSAIRKMRYHPDPADIYSVDDARSHINSLAEEKNALEVASQKLRKVGGKHFGKGAEAVHRKGVSVSKLMDKMETRLQELKEKRSTEGISNPDEDTETESDLENAHFVDAPLQRRTGRAADTDTDSEE